MADYREYKDRNLCGVDGIVNSSFITREFIIEI
jgi:hypothetical protein